MSFLDPDRVLQNLGIHTGAEVADFGAGIGHYSLVCAKIVGPSGKIYAIEVQKEMLERLAREAKVAGLNNIEVIWGDIETIGGTKLKDQSVDFVIISNVLFQVEDQSSLIKEAKRILRFGGKIILIDWSDSFGGLGPKPEAVISPAKIVTLMTAEGIEKVADFPAGDHHYGLVFKKITL